MISFIIIAQNESWRLDKCLKAIHLQIEFNRLVEYELIYIDSNSSDNSIEIAKDNQANKIFKISGSINAAIARNLGAKAASGQVLFFMDGDIELKPFDLKTILNADSKLKFSYVVGFLDDVNYTQDWKYVSQTPRGYKTIINDQKVTTVGGGIFIIEKETWNHFEGMNVRLKRTQDRDLSLRMAKNGIKGIRKAEIFGLHHTIPYQDSKRMWEMIFNGSFNYKGLMIRKHLLNPSFYPKLIREEWTMIILIHSFGLIFFNPLYILLYFMAVLIKTRKQLLTKSAQVVSHRILQDIIVFFSILFFFPGRPKFETVQICFFLMIYIAI